MKTQVFLSEPIGPLRHPQRATPHDLCALLGRSGTHPVLKKKLKLIRDGEESATGRAGSNHGDSRRYDITLFKILRGTRDAHASTQGDKGRTRFHQHHHHRRHHRHDHNHYHHHHVRLTFAQAQPTVERRVPC